ncbi:MFS transporter [Streptomyces sp. Da 82-17]|uniref:MFS transporter n=1 Tax=Streptomyces sp. Da 82-17 TaxID=3377116 RepID=UPI0038D42706
MQDTTVTAAPPKAGRREWIGLAVLALPTLLIALDIGVLFLALPHLSADLGTSGTEQLWISDIYGFMLAGFLLTMGSLGDRIGRRKLLMIGAAAFTVASVVAAYSTTPEMLIAARALLGVAGATLGPSTLALISNMFLDGRQRGIAISLWATCQFGGSALGPVIGGLMLGHFWWGSVFLLGVPVMAILLVAGPMLLPEYRDGNAGRIDFASVLLSLATILPIIYGIKEVAAGDAETPSVAFAAIAVGLAVGVVFVRRQLRLDDPLVDLRLFRKRSFRVVLTGMMLGSGAFAGASFMTSQYVQSVVGLSPTEAGLAQAPTGLGIAAGVLLAPVVTRWLKPSTAIVSGLLCSLVSLLVLTQLGSDRGLFLVVLFVALVGLGIGPLFALGTGIVVSSAPVEKAGAAASMSETSNVFGSTLGLAVLGTVGAAVYRNQVDSSVPDGLPGETVDAVRETIGGAVAAVEGLPSAVAGDTLDAARDAFTSGMNVVAAVSAAVVVLIAALTAVVLRQKDDGDAAPATPAQDDGTPAAPENQESATPDDTDRTARAAQETHA